MAEGPAKAEAGGRLKRTAMTARGMERGETGPIAGIDYGRRRIGVAVSDPSRRIATPSETIKRRLGRRPPIRRIVDALRKRRVCRAVVGLPLEKDGSETAWTREVRGFAARLAERGALSVRLRDERYSTFEARERLREAGGRARGRGAIDRAAAAVILQDYLDERRMEKPPA